MLKAINWVAVFCVFCVALFGVVGWRTYAVVERQPTLDKAQAQFECDNSMWNWAGWKDPAWDHYSGHGLTCKSKATVRSCSVLVPMFNGDGSHAGHKLMLFVCSTHECDWIIGSD